MASIARREPRILPGFSLSMGITLTVDDKPVQVKRSYNSRGLNHSRTFLGYYFIATDMTVDQPHHLSLSLPELPTGAFTGVFWENIETAKDPGKGRCACGGWSRNSRCRPEH